MVWQYLNARRALNLQAASRFAHGLGVDLANISPRLAKELAEVLALTSPSDNVAGADQDSLRLCCVKLLLKQGSKRFTVVPVQQSSCIRLDRDEIRASGYRSEALLVLRPSDDGMRPTLAADDLIVINTAEAQLRDGQVFAFNYEGVLLFRRAFRDAGTWWLDGDNSDTKRFPRKRYVQKHCSLIGRVVLRQSETI